MNDHPLNSQTEESEEDSSEVEEDKKEEERPSPAFSSPHTTKATPPRKSTPWRRRLSLSEPRRPHPTKTKFIIMGDEAEYDGKSS